MKRQLRFVLPTLFESHMLAALDNQGQQLFSSLKKLLTKADFTESHVDDLLKSHYGLGKDYQEYVPWLDKDLPHTESPILRADPVILEPTHNGIVCRGNDILHLALDEQDEIQELFNEHFAQDGLKLTFYSPCKAIIEIGEQQPADFSTLNEVLGQDISHHLPSGASGAYWQSVLLETQMLLHRAKCNLDRTEIGEKTVGSLWFWGSINKPEQPVGLTVDDLYSDSPLLCNAFPEHFNELTSFEAILTSADNCEVHTSKLELACLQNDTVTWSQVASHWISNYLVPALSAVNSGQLKQVQLVTEEGGYLYKSLHKYRFWRR